MRSFTVLVTGANGFVGRAVCEHVMRQGYALRQAVRLPFGSRITRDVVPIGSIDGNTDWSAAVAGVDAIVHLAARVHVMKETAADSIGAFRTVNVYGSEALAKAAVAHGVRRLVYVSSIKVNGEATGTHPFTSQDPPKPQDPYGISKWEAEQALWRIAGEAGLEVTVVRPPLVYGPGVGGNFARLLKLVRLGIPLPFGAIDNRRSMVYVGNLASALVACAVHPAAAGQTYLVSDGEALSTPDLIRCLAQMNGVRARLLPAPVGLLALLGKITGQGAEVDRLIGSLIVDSTALKTSLDWMPPFSVAEGLAHTARWISGLPLNHTR